MANYLYRCPEGHRIEQQFPIGTARRMLRCSCGQPAKLLIGEGVNIAPSALETKGAQVRASNVTEARWNKDMPAYKRMRHRGMQPKMIDGCEKLENEVGDQFDIDYGRFYKDGVTKERVLEGAEQAAEIMESA